MMARARTADGTATSSMANAVVPIKHVRKGRRVTRTRRQHVRRHPPVIRRSVPTGMARSIVTERTAAVMGVVGRIDRRSRRKCAPLRRRNGEKSIPTRPLQR